ncbi:MAG: NYN domain-containing protein [Chloroflexota bacterium]|jgi:uncharacterized protein
MHYLIDGHNLIAKLPGLSLEDPHDEIKLVQLLKRWCAADSRRKVTVVFDAGLPGGEARHLSGGGVKVVFAASNSSADAVLMRRIEQIKNPSAFTTISSDNAILTAARRSRVPVQRSETFATAMLSDRTFREKNADRAPAERPEAETMSPDELAEWLELFGPEPERPTAPSKPKRQPTAAENKREEARRKRETQQKKRDDELDEWLRLFGYKE